MKTQWTKKRMQALYDSYVEGDRLYPQKFRHLYIAPGNTKMDIANLSLPAKLTCVGCACWRDCYEMKAFTQYPETREARIRNLELWLNDPAEYERQFRSFLDVYKKPLFRHFSGGDYPDYKYYLMTVRVAKDFPNIKFLAFTKRHKDGWRFGHGRTSNYTVVLSMWHDLDEPMLDMPKAWMKDDAGKENRIPRSAIECHGNCDTCGICWDLPRVGRDVYFHQH